MASFDSQRSCLMDEERRQEVFHTDWPDVYFLRRMYSDIEAFEVSINIILSKVQCMSEWEMHVLKVR